MQNNFGRYLHIVMNGGEVIVTKMEKKSEDSSPVKLRFLT